MTKVNRHYYLFYFLSLRLFFFYKSPFIYYKKTPNRGVKMQEIIQAISTVGFPIVAFLLIFWKFDKSLGLLTEAVNNYTSAVQLLLQKEKEKNNN